MIVRGGEDCGTEPDVTCAGFGAEGYMLGGSGGVGIVLLLARLRLSCRGDWGFAGLLGFDLGLLDRL